LFQQIRTNDPDNNNNIYVELNLHDAGISCVNIRPSFNSQNVARGLCGNFNGVDNDDIINPSGAPIAENDMDVWQ
jgi:von Willebrand factor type D domain